LNRGNAEVQGVRTRLFLRLVAITAGLAGVSASAVAGDWQTTIVRVAPAVAARDASWTAVVYAGRASDAFTTGSVQRDARVFRPADGPRDSGPRLTGKLHELNGLASYYWQGQMTATGERFDKRAMTAAHKTLPFGTKVRVMRLDNGGSVVVRINDRGPFKPGRVIDLSERAAEEIGMTGRGIMPVRLEVLGK
jgi:rare lipoprotein A